MRDNRGIKVTPDDDDDDDLVRAWPRLVVSPYARGFPRPDTISFSRLGNPLPPLLARVATAQFLPRSPPIRSPLISKEKYSARRVSSFPPSHVKSGVLYARRSKNCFFTSVIIRSVAWIVNTRIATDELSKWEEREREQRRKASGNTSRPEREMKVSLVGYAFPIRKWVYTGNRFSNLST